jgi:hypothetical protein
MSKNVKIIKMITNVQFYLPTQQKIPKRKNIPKTTSPYGYINGLITTIVILNE